MDYERTRKYYTDLKQAHPTTTIKYEALADEIEYYKWVKRCQDSDGNWHKDPKKPEINYPLKSINCIIREMTRDGEYLKSRQMWIGLNAYLDQQSISRVDPEIYTETLFGKRRIQDPNNRDNIITEPSGIASQTTKYTLPFTPENLDVLYEMRDQGFCYLIVSDKRRDVPPRDVANYDDFRNKAFDALMASLQPGATVPSESQQQKPAARR
jgi:hypothetical protein